MAHSPPFCIELINVADKNGGRRRNQLTHVDTTTSFYHVTTSLPHVTCDHNIGEEIFLLGNV